MKGLNSGGKEDDCMGCMAEERRMTGLNSGGKEDDRAA